jgi:hypothetical protein
MSLKKYSTIILILIFIQSCAGTHGKIISFEFSTCKDELNSKIFSLKNDSKIQVIDSTDDSGINRPGYFDIIIKDKGKSYYYKMHYFGDTEYWETHKEICELAIIEINNKYDKDFSIFSSEKREAIKIFKKIIIPQLIDLSKCK